MDWLVDLSIALLIGSRRRRPSSSSIVRRRRRCPPLSVIVDVIFRRGRRLSFIPSVVNSLSSASVRAASDESHSMCNATGPIGPVILNWLSSLLSVPAETE